MLPRSLSPASMAASSAPAHAAPLYIDLITPPPSPVHAPGSVCAPISLEQSPPPRAGAPPAAAAAASSSGAAAASAAPPVGSSRPRDASSDSDDEEDDAPAAKQPKYTFSPDRKDDEDEECMVVDERGDFANRNFPHARENCGCFHFSPQNSYKFCGACYCYVCDGLASKCMDEGTWPEHKDARDDKGGKWSKMRSARKNPPAAAAAMAMHFTGTSILQAITRVHPVELATPPAFRGTLKVWQRQSLGFMVGIEDNANSLLRRGWLCDAVGMGKTASCCALMLARPPPATAVGCARVTVVVVMNDLVVQWANEIAKFAPSLRLGIYYNTSQSQSKLRAEKERIIAEMRAGRMDVVVTTPAMVKQFNHGTFLIPAEERKIHRLIADEAHKIVGTTDSQGTSFGWGPYQILEPDRFWLVTATPLLGNDTTEECKTWALRLEVHKCNGQLLNQALVLWPKGHPTHHPYFPRELFLAHMLRHTHDQAIGGEKNLDIETKFSTRLITLTSQDLKKYKLASCMDCNTAVTHARVKTRELGIHNRTMVLLGMTPDKQADVPRWVDHPLNFFNTRPHTCDSWTSIDFNPSVEGQILQCKAKAALDVCNELIAGSREFQAKYKCQPGILIFVKEPQATNSLHSYLLTQLGGHGAHLFKIMKETPVQKRHAQYATFQQTSNSALKIMVVQMAAGATGLNLTGAQTVLLFDVTVDEGIRTQAIGRAERLGQTCPISVITLVCRDTIDVQTFSIQESNRTSGTARGYSPNTFTCAKHFPSGYKTTCKVLHHTQSFFKHCETMRCDSCGIDVVLEESVRYEPLAKNLNYLATTKDWAIDGKIGRLPIVLGSFGNAFFRRPVFVSLELPKAKFTTRMYMAGNDVITSVFDALMQWTRAPAPPPGPAVPATELFAGWSTEIDTIFTQLIASASFDDRPVLRVLKQIHADWRAGDQAFWDDDLEIERRLAAVLPGSLPDMGVELSPPILDANRPLEDDASFATVLSALSSSNPETQRQVRAILSDDTLDKAAKQQKIKELLKEAPAGSAAGSAAAGAAAAGAAAAGAAAAPHAAAAAAHQPLLIRIKLNGKEDGSTSSADDESEDEKSDDNGSDGGSEDEDTRAPAPPPPRRRRRILEESDDEGGVAPATAQGVQTTAMEDWRPTSLLFACAEANRLNDVVDVQRFEDEVARASNTSALKIAANVIDQIKADEKDDAERIKKIACFLWDFDPSFIR